MAAVLIRESNKERRDWFMERLAGIELALAETDDELRTILERDPVLVKVICTDNLSVLNEIQHTYPDIHTIFVYVKRDPASVIHDARRNGHQALTRGELVEALRDLLKPPNER